MVAECISILAITFCMLVLFVRAGHGDYALSLIPLLLVPALHLMAIPVLHLLGAGITAFPLPMIHACVDIAAMTISCLCIILLSGKIKSKKNKRLYVALLSTYNIILTCAFVVQTLSPLLEAYRSQQ